VPWPSETVSGEEFQNWWFRNWLGNVSVRSERHFVPGSLQSLVRVVADAAQNGRRHRPARGRVGGGDVLERPAATDR
jgi:hypothetical protein